MKAKHILVSFFVALCVLCSSISSISVSALTVYIDNDDDVYNTQHQGFNTYLTSTNYYRGDARRQATGNYNYHDWYLGNNSIDNKKRITVKLYAYVNDYSFTDPRAKYSAVCSYEQQIGTLNQNTATGGWNLVSTVVLKPLTAVGENRVSFHGVVLYPSTVSGYNTGADGVKYNITYK